MDVVCEESCQDWWVVISILQHMLVAVKERFPHVTEVILCSDNAKCYASNDFYSSIGGLGAPLGIRITEVLHSEVQEGKTEVDGHIGSLKRMVRLLVPRGTNGNLDAATATDLFHRIVHVGRPQDMVALLAKPNADGDAALKSLTGAKIKDVSKISALTFHEDGRVTAWRSADLSVLRQFSAAEWAKIRRPHAAAVLWNGTQPRHTTVMSGDDVELPDVPYTPAPSRQERKQRKQRMFIVRKEEPRQLGDLIPCKVAYCRQTFVTLAALHRHMARGAHVAFQKLKDVALTKAHELMSRPTADTHLRPTDTAALAELATVQGVSESERQERRDLLEEACSAIGELASGWGASMQRRRRLDTSSEPVQRLRQMFDEGARTGRKYDKKTARAQLVLEFPAAKSSVPSEQQIMALFSKWSTTTERVEERKRKKQAERAAVAEALALFAAGQNA